MAEKFNIPPGVAALRDELIRAGHRACPVGCGHPAVPAGHPDPH